MPERRTKTFDAVEMSRRLREQTSRKLAALTREQRVALLNRQIPMTGSALAEDEPILREEPPAYGGKASE
jgi:hypothetical protein